MTFERLREINPKLPKGFSLEKLWKRCQRAAAAGSLDWSNPLTLFQITYRYDPVRYVHEVFGVTPDPGQLEVLHAVEAAATGEGHRQVAARSGHGVGKTACVSWVLLWFITTRNPANAIVTAPAAGTIEDGIGKEIKLWLKRLPASILALFESKTERIELREDPEGTFLSMRTSRAENTQALAGIHSDNVLLVVDEASAVVEGVYEAAYGSMSSDNAMMLLIGNPTKREGYFYDCFHTMRDEWATVHISCLDSPRVSHKFIESIAKKYGKDSNEYRVRVLGEFPTANADAVIPADAVEAAVDRDIAAMQYAPIWGLDVARSLNRDKSVLVKRKANVLLPTNPQRLLRRETLHTPAMLRWQYNDTMLLVGAVKHEWDNTPESERPSTIAVDGIGFGAVVGDALRAQGLPVVIVNVSESAAMKDQYANLKAELWYLARDWFTAKNCAIPGDGELIKELTVVEQRHTTKGKIIVQDKEEIRKLYRISPDGADAFVLTFAVPAALATPGQHRALDESRPLRRNAVVA